MTTTLIALKTFTRKVNDPTKLFERIDVGANFHEDRPEMLSEMLRLQVARHADAAFREGGE